MSAPKFTPGPWTTNGGQIVARDYGWAGARIAYTEFQDLKSGTFDTLKAEANAALIAAAPDLWAALKNVVARIEKGQNEELHHPSEVSYLKELLARAEGRKP